MKIFKQGWKNLIKQSKYDYDDYLLGSDMFFVDEHEIKRIDFDINYDNNKLQCTLYKNVNINSDICIIYLHSMSGSRLEGYQYLDIFLPYLNFCLFEYAGTGKSDGKYITLGIKEAEQLNILIERLKSEYQIKSFILWGRSMGASTIINYLKNINNESIHSVILDSPFKTLKGCIKDTLKYNNNIPKIVTSMFLYPIKKKCYSKTGVDIFSNKPCKYLYNMEYPVLFLVGNNDKITPKFKVEELFNRYGYYKKFRNKKINIFEGEHHTERDEQVITTIKEFIDEHLPPYNNLNIVKTYNESLEEPKSNYKYSRS